MHEIIRRMWDRELTLKKWSELNGFKWRYVQQVILRKRGRWGAGVAKKITTALVNQGFATREELGGGDK